MITRANITLNQSFTDEREINQAVQSGLENYVLENESGLQDLCGRWFKSIGQKQRLSIARALIRKNTNLIIGEALFIFGPIK